MTYNYRIIKVNKKAYGVRYVALSPDFPGFSGGGNTKQRARHVLHEAICLLLGKKVELKRIK